jgi:methylenetetrahydrofolate dehydrogenase (NADP+)/methenyltetrahydrofolate cyclohydrolase
MGREEMTAKIISGSEVAKEIREELKKEVASLKERHNLVPGLVTILVGEDPASVSYVTAKQKTSHELGFHSIQDNQPPDMAEDDLLKLIDQYNKDSKIHGILVQLPLPKHIDEGKVLYTIDPRKDVDGFHPVNVGKLMIGEPDYLPCTPAGIQQLLITVCHTRTKDMTSHTRAADILIVAAGKPKAITADMVKEGAVVIDVGVNRIGKTPEGKAILCGDVDFEAVKERASAITPVPGGVGPMTITMLMMNTVKAAKLAAGIT